MKQPSRPAAAQAGFTLIELIVVIVILGVLAAVALPRFTALQGDARFAKLNAYAGSIRSAAALAKSAAVARSVDCSLATGTNVAVEGGTVNMAHCYPAATALGIGFAANLGSGTADGYQVTYDATATPPVATLQITGAATPASCQLTYTEPTGANAPAIVLVTGSATAC